MIFEPTSLLPWRIIRHEHCDHVHFPTATHCHSNRHIFAGSPVDEPTTSISGIIEGYVEFLIFKKFEKLIYYRMFVVFNKIETYIEFIVGIHEPIQQHTLS